MPKANELKGNLPRVLMRLEKNGTWIMGAKQIGKYLITDYGVLFWDRREDEMYVYSGIICNDGSMALYVAKPTPKTDVYSTITKDLKERYKRFLDLVSNE